MQNNFMFHKEWLSLAQFYTRIYLAHFQGERHGKICLFGSSPILSVFFFPQTPYSQVDIQYFFSPVCISFLFNLNSIQLNLNLIGLELIFNLI
jgi:hypothetical protein